MSHKHSQKVRSSGSNAIPEEIIVSNGEDAEEYQDFDQIEFPIDQSSQLQTHINIDNEASIPDLRSA